MSSIHEAIGVTLLDARRIARGEPTPKALAFAAMRYSHGALSRGTYRFLQRVGSAPTSWQASLTEGAGLCQANVLVMIAILAAFGIRSREIGLAYDTRSHVVIEVEWDDARHMLDPTWGVWFERGENVLSLEEVDALSDPLAYCYSDDAAIAFADGPLDYLTAERETIYHDWV